MIKTNHAIIGCILPMVILTMYFSNMMDDVWAENTLLKEKVNHLESLLNIEQYEVTATIYHAVRGQTDRTPHITADGTRIKTWKATEYRYVALSRDLLSRWGGPFEYGDYVIIEGTDGWDGVYQVRDTMNPKWVKRVDILTTNSRFKYTDVKMYKYVKSNDDMVDNS